MKGRKPLPSNVKRLRGTDQPCRMNKNEPEPAADNIEPTIKLSRKAKAHWRRTLKQLDEAKVVTNLDAHALTIYCVQWETWQEAVERLAEFGMIVKSPSGHLQQSPYLGISNRAMDQMTRILTEFGMTPSSRTRVNATGDKKDDNPFAAFAKGA